MIQKRIIALHGNPGSPDDWKLIQSELPGIAFSCPSIYDSNWIEHIRDNPPGSVILMGHSFGCALLLKHWTEYRQQIHSVVLCSPFLAGGRSVSPLTRILLQLPWLGPLLMRLSHRKISEHLFHQIVSPILLSAGSPQVTEALASVKKNIDDLKLWQKMILLKISSLEVPFDPLAKADQISGIAILGEKDLISEFQTHRDILLKFPRIRIHSWPKEGHGLIWSAAPQIANLLQQEILSG